MQKSYLGLALTILALLPGCFDKKSPVAPAASENSTPLVSDQELNSNIEKLVKISKVQENIIKEFDENLNQVKNLSGADKEAIETMSTKLHAAINSEATFKNICAAYAKHFNNTEILALIAFYNTPAGQKLAEVAPAIRQDLQMLMAQAFQTIMMEEMQAKAAKAPVPAAKDAKAAAPKAPQAAAVK